ncbi:Metalloproteases (zincins) catalytic [Penicillium hispanicum]|uniref:Metalloproteases (zincins) catalytic n=1 Tax=Penicillium hispanicum TaxID=1080232 RepID=UPI0025410647|nr:Metalloproteases (zincins) catalytic [Penicillium hispanicum]KAJ5578385.1 Metalloproteases (zincins) catalytic [Penicillium hispanicum]
MAAPAKFILLLLWQVLGLQFVTGLSIPKRDGQYSMNQNGITWDASCDKPNPQNGQETRRMAVQRAWVGALELIDTAWTRFNTVTWPTVKEVKLNSIAQQHINQHDPGSVVFLLFCLSSHLTLVTNHQAWMDSYVQFFALDSSADGTMQIQRILRNLATKLNSDPGTSGRESNTQVVISCKDSFMYDGVEHCEEDWAATRSEINEPSSTINFCPSFFGLPRFDQLKSGSQDAVRAEYHSDQYTGTDALTVKHEVTHFWWIGPTNEDLVVEETYGLVECAELAWNCGQPIPDNPNVIWNAETYAWYGEYGYFVDKGVQNLWPPSRPQPVVLPLRNY